MKNAWPISAKASGGGHYRGNYIDQNLNVFGRIHVRGRRQALPRRPHDGRRHNEFASYAARLGGSAVISASGHTPARCRISRTQNPTNLADVTWRRTPKSRTPTNWNGTT